MTIKTKGEMRERRKQHIQKMMRTHLRPRLVVFKSLKHIYVQLINDEEGVTVVSSSTVTKDFKTKNKNGCNVSAAKMVGTEIAKKAIEKGIKEVMFDRNGFVYHGRIKALADSAREAGLKF